MLLSTKHHNEGENEGCKACVVNDLETFSPQNRDNVQEADDVPKLSLRFIFALIRHEKMRLKRDFFPLLIWIQILN